MDNYRQDDFQHILLLARARYPRCLAHIKYITHAAYMGFFVEVWTGVKGLLPTKASTDFGAPCGLKVLKIGID